MTQPLQITSFNALKPGKHLVVFGGVHGNERCGPEAIQRVISMFNNGELVLVSGKITLVPVCNPLAYARNIRFVDRNLNRYFYPKETVTQYEDTLDAPLCSILDEADYFLDIHSYQSKGGPFCFLGTSSTEEIAYSRAVGAPSYIYGWAEAFSQNATDEQKRASIGTTDYTRDNGRGACAVTLECGHHHNADNVANAMEGIHRAMEYCGLIATSLPPIDASAQQCVHMHEVFYKEKPGAFTKPWQHLDIVSKGEAIAQYDDGSVLCAPENGVIVLPKTATDHALGAEWFYFGVPADFPAL